MRPEITGRAVFVGEPSKTITEFCRAEKISRAKYYGLKKAGKAPAEMRVDGIIRITPEAHADWRRANTVTGTTD
jgi:hypothetical protein